MNELAVKFRISLALTWVLELPASFVLGVRGKDLLLVFLVNLLTNPAAVLASTLMRDGFLAQIFIETVVILVEGWYYETYGRSSRRPYLCAAVCNLFSYFIGKILLL